MYFDSLLLTKSTPEKVAIKVGGECTCTKCAHGCNYGSGALKKGEEKKIAKFLGIKGEKELKKYNEDEAGAKGENPAEKLKEAQNEVKKYKQRLKFAQSQIQNLEKAKKAAASKGTNDKKLSHLEKMLDKQKQLKSKADTEVANYKRDNHKLSQENKILSNKIKELVMKLDKKNKSAA